MVGFWPQTKENERLTNVEYSIAGCVSGIFARALCQPFDVLKIRFQLQLEPIRKQHAHGKYFGLFQAANTIIKEEGWKSLWKGHMPAQGLSLTYGLIQFLSYELLTEKAFRVIPEEWSGSVQSRIFVSFFCGALSGTLANTVALPFDVIRTRLVAQGEPKIFRNSRHAAKMMFKNEGVVSFYRGLTPALLQIAPYSGLVFSFYELSQTFWNKFIFDHISNSTNDVTKAIVCGGTAGVAAKSLLYPLDVLKKRLQVVGFEQARTSFGRTFHYSGFLHCIISTVVQEGYAGLYKGFLPSILKAAAANACGFFFYEQTCNLFRSLRKSNDNNTVKREDENN
ncbi:Mitochondrial thiamine pyrophosphate carrier [Trichinella zimbabwensis]|uniref:Mitochondrial thiamine pyrophosphate carrier n=1 Tax=Trichinella zimbabwensis TaxID=268475 RepID=A0A0V1I2R1_9BILA|nr:Mitochondrial thiamine pyrophosphate carrier [Trichinella zimbabwensis]